MTIKEIKEILGNTNGIFVFPFDTCPLDEKYLSQHGGDEDYVIIANPNNPAVDHVVDRLTVCDYEEYELENGLNIYITAHA